MVFLINNINTHDVKQPYMFHNLLYNRYIQHVYQSNLWIIDIDIHTLTYIYIYICQNNYMNIYFVFIGIHVYLHNILGPISIRHIHVTQFLSKHTHTYSSRMLFMFSFMFLIMHINRVTAALATRQLKVENVTNKSTQTS